MSNMWGYPYRLGIGLFLTVGTVLITFFFVGITIWLEKAFKKDKQKK